jgi:hypothetical protein
MFLRVLESRRNFHVHPLKAALGAPATPSGGVWLLRPRTFITPGGNPLVKFRRDVIPDFIFRSFVSRALSRREDAAKHPVRKGAVERIGSA